MFPFICFCYYIFNIIPPWPVWYLFLGWLESQTIVSCIKDQFGPFFILKILRKRGCNTEEKIQEACEEVHFQTGKIV